MLSALAHSMLRDHVHLWITFVFCSNTCVLLNITKTSPQHHATLSAFHAFAVHDLYSLSIARTCTIARITYVAIFRSVWTPEQASCLLCDHHHIVAVLLNVFYFRITIWLRSTTSLDLIWSPVISYLNLRILISYLNFWIQFMDAFVLTIDYC
jgi:hypothetical protein